MFTDDEEEVDDARPDQDATAATPHFPPRTSTSAIPSSGLHPQSAAATATPSSAAATADAKGSLLLAAGGTAAAAALLAGPRPWHSEDDRNLRMACTSALTSLFLTRKGDLQQDPQQQLHQPQQQLASSSSVGGGAGVRGCARSSSCAVSARLMTLPAFSAVLPSSPAQHPLLPILQVSQGLG